MEQSWKPASQNIQACTYKRTKGTGSLEQANITKKGTCSLNKDSKTSKLNKINKQAPKAEDMDISSGRDIQPPPRIDSKPTCWPCQQQIYKLQ